MTRLRRFRRAVRRSVEPRGGIAASFA